jgi:hypothetical protein
VGAANERKDRMTRLKLFTGLVTLAATAVVATGASGSAPATGAQGGCTVKKNVEAIIDDSGSMSITDFNELRVQAMNLLMSTPGNERKTLGAIQFGTDATSLFDPAPIGPNRTRFSQTLGQQIQADDGGTDYNNAFDLAKTHNPGADARIFLTDGAHSGTYNEGHKGGPTTHVIGLGSSIQGEDNARLQRIADETGGIYRKANEAGELQAAMNDIGSEINCSQAPVDYTDTFKKTGSKSHVLRVPAGIRSVNFALSWANSGDKFDIGSFRVVRNGKTVARKAAKVRRLKVRKRTGATFVTVKVSKMVRGKLRFKVSAKRLSSTSTATGVKLITQASRSRKR